LWRYCGQSLALGLLLGSIWWAVDDGDYGARMSLLATSYLCINVLVVDSIPGTAVAVFTLLTLSWPQFLILSDRHILLFPPIKLIYFTYTFRNL
jgi:hypothetical protein